MYENFEEPNRNILEGRLFSGAQKLCVAMTILLYLAALITTDIDKFFEFILFKLFSFFPRFGSLYITLLAYYFSGIYMFVSKTVFTILSIHLVFSWTKIYSLSIMIIANTLVGIFSVNLLYQLFYKKGFTISTLEKGLSSIKGVLMKFIGFIALQNIKINLILQLTSIPFFFIDISGFSGITHNFILFILIIALVIWCLLVTYFSILAKNSVFYVSAAFICRQKIAVEENEKARREKGLKEAKKALENNYATVIEATTLEIKSLLKGFALPLSHTLARTAMWDLSHEDALEKTILTKNKTSGQKFSTWNAVFQILVSCSVIDSVVTASSYVIYYKLVELGIAPATKEMFVLKQNFTNFPVIFFTEVYSRIVFYAFLGGLTVCQVVVGLDDRDLGLKMNKNVVSELDKVDGNTETNNTVVEDQYIR